jgi:hypothetical protein
VQRLAELRLVADGLLADADLACGRAAEVASELEGLAAEQPQRESFHARLMVALYRSGRQAVWDWRGERVERTFDIEGNRAVAGPHQPGQVVGFSPEGTRLVTMSTDGTARVWALDRDELIDVAEAGLQRGLSDDECRQYLHVDRCPST